MPKKGAIPTTREDKDDIRKGDVLRLAGGFVEVLSVVSNNEGGLDMSVRFHKERGDLQLTVLRRGGPDARDEDKETRPEEHDDDEEKPEEPVSDEEVK